MLLRCAWMEAMDGWVCDVEVGVCGGARLASRHGKFEIRLRGLGKTRRQNRSVHTVRVHSKNTYNKPCYLAPLRCLAPGVDCSSPHMSPNDVTDGWSVDFELARLDIVCFPGQAEIYTTKALKRYRLCSYVFYRRREIRERESTGINWKTVRQSWLGYGCSSFL